MGGEKVERASKEGKAKVGEARPTFQSRVNLMDQHHQSQQPLQSQLPNQKQQVTSPRKPLQHLPNRRTTSKTQKVSLKRSRSPSRSPSPKTLPSHPHPLRPFQSPWMSPGSLKGIEKQRRRKGNNDVFSV